MESFSGILSGFAIALQPYYLMWALVGTAIAALIVSILVPLRATPQAEADGPDAIEHGQQSWDFR